ncbi:MAG: heparinase II/III family protein, partial [Candidatus Latescibacteria bacterium]|nr:heparinase II/III family protein [Candidatus Latescibacterota bacterium]
MPAPEYPEYQFTEDPVSCKLEYKAYFADLRKYINVAMMDLSLAFLMTEDAQYAEAAKRILLAATEWPTDDADVTSVMAKWGDEPGLSMSRCMHRAYDWLYDALDNDERAKVLQMCEERAWQTHRRLVNRHNYLTQPGESHAGRLIAYLSEMAIVMAGESDGAKTWLDYSLKALTTFYPHWAGFEGGWAEGISYGRAYNAIYSPALEGVRKACDYDLWQRPFFRQVRHFFFYCTSVHSEMRPFGDGAERGNPGEGVEGGDLATLMAHHAHLFNDPNLGWWVNKIQGKTGRTGEMAMIFEDEIPFAAPTEIPNSRVFRGIGWAGLHSDLADPANDTCMIFKSSPFGSVSHSHADQNAFAIMKGGKALAIPSGHYGPAYGQPHHAEWTRSTKANNCVLVNGEGQVIRDANASGRIVAFEERKGMTYVVGDASAAYMGKLTQCDRHILFLRPGLFLSLDELAAPENVIFQWMLHAFEEMEVGEAQIISRHDGSALDVRLSSPAGLKLSQTDQFDTPYNDRIPEQFHED